MIHHRQYRIVQKYICIIAFFLTVFSFTLQAAEYPTFQHKNIREALYEGSFSKSVDFFTQEEKKLLKNKSLDTLLLAALSHDELKQLLILKTTEVEYRYSFEQLVAKKIHRKNKKQYTILQKLKNDNKIIMRFIRNNTIENLYYEAAEYAFAMIPVFGDAGKVYSMQASKFMRVLLKENKKDVSRQVHYGIYIAYLINTQKHTEVNNLTALALSLLSDKNIKSVQNKILQYRAYCYKSSVYMKNYNSKTAYYYNDLARDVFPNTQLPHIGEIYYNAAAEKKELYRITSFKTDIDMPYYADMGLYYRKGDFGLLSPYIGIGLKRTFFSSAWFAQAGLKLYYKHFKWNIGYAHAFTPDFAVLNIKLLEGYGINTFALRLNGFELSTQTKAGYMVFAKNPLNGQEIRKKALKRFAIKQNVRCGFTLYNDGLNHISGELESGIFHIPTEKQTFGYIQAQLPATVYFGQSEVGFLPQMTYADYITKTQTLNALNRHPIYRSSILLTKQESDADTLCYAFYNITGNIDCTYRIFLTPLQAPADRLYVGLHGNIGFGKNMRVSKTDILYAGGLSFGFQLYDIRPFELRFQMDQNKNIFFMMTVLNPIRHKK